MPRVVLVTGFEPYAGRGRNPSAEMALRLDGDTIGGALVAGRVLPVRFERLPAEVDRLLEGLSPAAVVGTGLWPGAPTIRLERFAVNLGDCEIPDNAGTLLDETILEPDRETALRSRLPLRRIEAALLDAGIPATLSNSAGTFLCNAVMYRMLEATGPEVPAGFVHLPYLPEQVAELVRGVRAEHALELHQRADLASMSDEVIERALRIVVEETVRALEGVEQAA